MIIVDWLNRWRYAYILWADRVLARWEYRRDMARESNARGRAEYINAAAKNWKRWGTWSSGRKVTR